MNTEHKPGNREVLILAEIERLVADCAGGVFPRPEDGEPPSAAVVRRLEELEPRLARIQSLRTCERV